MAADALMQPSAAPAYAQVLGLGLLWTSVHCAGMCGPVLVGLDVAGVSRGETAWGGAKSILTYQAGRGLTYSAFGAAAGLLGAGLVSHLEAAGSWVALILGLVVVGGVIWAVVSDRAVRIARGEAQTEVQPDVQASSATTSVATGRLRIAQGDTTGASSGLAKYGLGRRLGRFALPLAGSGRPVDQLALGAVLALMPCMIPMWVLGLAATTASPLHGAALMWVLVAMTTPVLLGATLLPRMLSARLRRAGGWVPRGLLGVSGIWMMMVGLAGLGIAPHAHWTWALPEAVGGQVYVVMLW